MKKFIPLVCTLLFTGAVSVMAASGPGTKNVTLNLKGTGTVANPSAACTVGFSNTCPSGECQCIQVTGPSATGNLKGASISNFFVTVDQGTDLADEPPPVDGEPNQKCNPIFASLDVASSQFSGRLNMVAVSCKHFVGISAKNPSGTHDKDIIGGGWGISSNPAPSPLAAGGGLLTGTVIQSNQALSLKLSGPVSQ